MNIRKLCIISTAAYLLISAVFQVDCQQRATSKFTANITPIEGEAFTVPNFVRNSFYTDLALDTGDFDLTIPFEIIKNIKFGFDEKNELQAEVLLDDGSVIRGGTWGSFFRQTDLGDIEIGLGDIRQIEFSHKPLVKYSYKTNGKHTVILSIGDSNKAIKGATFVYDLRANQIAYYDYFYFEMKGNSNPIQVLWKKIRYMTPANPDNQGTDDYAPLKITTTENKEYFGKCSIWSGMPQVIEGSYQYSTNYDLKIRIHIPNINMDRAISRIEFK